MFKDFDVIIFDCDGVLLDSNNIKVDVMKAALSEIAVFSDKRAREILNLFKKNFGRSRYYHCEMFSRMADKASVKPEHIYEKLLFLYESKLDIEYKKAPVIPSVIRMLDDLTEKGKKLYVASGSEQEQLRSVLVDKSIACYFLDILGSPETKTNNVLSIKQKYNNVRIAMVGDSEADFEAARGNEIDFVAFVPFSNSIERMLELAKAHNFTVINSF